MWVVVPLFYAAVALFTVRIVPWLSEMALFVMKLASFVTTTSLGVVGIVSDFKDRAGNLTRAGKLNLAGLALGAVVGIVAQKAEYDHSVAASLAQKKVMADLIEQNQVVMRQATRNLEVVGTTIIVTYRARFPEKLFFNGPEIFKNIYSKAEKVTAKEGEFSDAHTRTLKTAEGIDIMFDESSKMMPKEANGMMLATVPFTIEFFNGIPKFSSSCKPVPQPDSVFSWSGSSAFGGNTWLGTSASRNTNMFLVASLPETDYIEQRSSAVFFQNSNAGELFSVLDYSKKFIWIKLESEVELQKLTLQIGQRTFEILPAQLVRGECRLLGSQLPEIR
jgi:hypothetical protein